MTLATKKPAFLLLPRTLDPTVGNRQWLDCAAQWHRTGGASLVAAPAGPMAADYARCGIPHTPLPATPTLLQHWKKRHALTELVQRARPSLIWLQDIADWRLIRRAVPPRSLVRCLVYQPLAATKLNQKLVQDFILSGGEVVTNSQFVFSQLEQDFTLTDNELTLVLPGIDPVHFDPQQVRPDRALRLAADWRVPENAALFLHCGDLKPDGGQISLFHALAQTGRRDVYAVILGQETVPGYREKLLGAVNHYGLAGQILFTDHCPDLPAALWLAQAVVCASRAASGVDPLLLAAQAMGRPLLVSDSGAHLELVEPGYSAWVYPASDAQALHNAMLEILGLGEKSRLAYGERARDWVTDKFPYPQWRSAMLGDTAQTSAAEAAA